MRRIVRTATLIVFLATLPQTGLANDWPQWRGPNRDGLIASFKSPKQWPERLKLRWKVSVGSGHASPVLVGNRIYLLARQGEQEVISSYDLKSGKQLWRRSYAADYVVHEAAVPHGKGPRSTPLVHAGRVYALGVSGRISCLDAKTGRLLWQKEPTGNDPKAYPLFGFAPSPLIVGGLVVIATGGEQQSGLTAFDAATGEVRWNWRGEYTTPHDGVGYSSPVLMKINDSVHLVMLVDSGLVGLSPQSGSVLWRFAFAMPHESVPTPILDEDRIIISDQKMGLVAVRVSKQGPEWQAQQVWQNRELFNYMSSPVAQDGLLFGMSRREKGQYFCVELQTGKTLWKTAGRQGESAVVMMGSNELFVQTVDGELLVAKKSRGGFDLVKRYQVADSATWSHPIIFDQYIVVKDSHSLALWSLN